MSIADIRHSYEKNVLLESSLADNPFDQFAKWFDDALAANLLDLNAMTLATTTTKGRPSARIVLLKGFDDQGFVFFTNYESRKGLELMANPHASLLFFWPTLERQVRIEGIVEKTSTDESSEYFNSRPLDSRVGAWASPQSRPIELKELEDRSAAFAKSLGTHPACPPHWGGYRLKPDYVEFWQGRPSRLHDRLVFKLEQEKWASLRLAP